MKRSSVTIRYSKQVNVYAYEPIKMELETTLVAEDGEEITGKDIAEESGRLTAMVEHLLKKELQKESERSKAEE